MSSQPPSSDRPSRSSNLPLESSKQSTDGPKRRPLRDERFGTEKRIKRRAEFLRIQSGGTKHSSRHFLLSVALRSALPETAVDSPANAAAALMRTRIGITVTKKVDKRAARRNRLKRRVRECFRKAYRRFDGPPMDLVLIARDGATECSYEQVRKEFHYLLYQAHILPEVRGRAPQAARAAARSAVGQPTKPAEEE